MLEQTEENYIQDDPAPVATLFDLLGGDIGVRFDKLNELRDEKIPEPVKEFWARGAWQGSQRMLQDHLVCNSQTETPKR